MVNLFVVENWPLAVKVGLPPAFALLAAILITVLGLNGLQYQVGTFERVLNENVGVSESLKELEAELLATDGQFYNVMTSTAAQVENFDTKAGFEKVKARVDGMIDTTGKLAVEVSQLDAEAGKQIGELPAELQTYKETIDVVAELMDIDFNSAVSVIEPFRKNYAELIAKTKAAVSKVQKLSQQSLVESREDASSVQASFIIIAVISAISVIALSAFIIFNFVRSSSKLADVTAEMASGNYDVDLDRLERKDELGKIVDSLKLFRTELIQGKELEEQQRLERQKAEEERLRRLEDERERERMEQLRQKESEEQSNAERRAMMNKLADDFDKSVNSTVEELQATVMSVLKNVNEVRDSAEENNLTSESLHKIVENVTSSMNNVMAASEEMSASIQEISRQVTGAAQLSGSAVDAARRSSESVVSLNEMSQRIGAVVTIINDIAEQTNLLALNATIEAARAGDAGKGFAVVASEVKNLANQTGEATGEIGDQISAMQAATGDVVKMIDEVTEVIRKLDEVSAAISSSVDEQGAATQEISRSVSMAATEMTEAAQGSTKMTQIASVNGRAAEQMSGAMEVLDRNVERMRANVNTFVEEIRN
ncbi:methyl-accepting chemotaxis protein [Emcibacter sp.]|uniref:methyl-accepting chemotaxis protein n=1 Tax=Emcibacter sp. TaxID=1979954 RepID=UPI003A921125